MKIKAVADTRNHIKPSLDVYAEVLSAKIEDSVNVDELDDFEQQIRNVLNEITWLKDQISQSKGSELYKQELNETYRKV